MPRRRRAPTLTPCSSLFSSHSRPFSSNHFPSVDAKGIMWTIETTMDFIFIFDIFVNFRTAVEDESSGELITDGWAVAQVWFCAFGLVDFDIDAASLLCLCCVCCCFLCCGCCAHDTTLSCPLTSSFFNRFSFKSALHQKLVSPRLCQWNSLWTSPNGWSFAAVGAESVKGVSCPQSCKTTAIPEAFAIDQGIKDSQ